MNMMLKLVIGISFFLLVGCNTLNQRTENAEKTVGSIVGIQNSKVFKTSATVQNIRNNSSIALVLNSESPYRLLLTDGRVAWSKRLGQLVSVDVTKQAFSVEGITPEWKMIQPRGRINIVDATKELYIQSPTYVTQQGRKLNSILKQNLFNWPQFKIEAANAMGWVSLFELQFVPKSHNKLAITGLIQKPFLGLIGQTLPSLPKEVQYKEIFMTGSKLNSVTISDWELQQVIILDSSENRVIQSVGLFSSDQESCYMFAVNGLDEQISYYGYCSDFSPPTPVIIDFIQDKTELVLKILLISGDEEWQIELPIN